MNATTADLTMTSERAEEANRIDEDAGGAGGRITSRRIDSEVVARLQKAYDALLVSGIGFYTFLEIAGAWDRFELVRGILIVTFAAFVFLTFARETDGYKLSRLKEPVSALARMILTMFVAAAAAAGAALAAGMAAPWVSAWVTTWLALALIGLGLQRIVVAILLSRAARAGRLARRVAFIGDGEAVAEAIRRVGVEGPEDIDICGFFDDRDDNRTDETIAGYPKLGNIDDLIEFSRWFRIDTVIVTLPLTAETRLLELLQQLWEIPADIRISALGSKLQLNTRAYSKIGELPLLDTFDRPISSWNSLVKNAFDRVTAALAIVLLAPVFAGVAIAVRLDSPGPILFRQRRYGFNNELIEIFKFRSMRNDAADSSASKLVTRDDPRVTRLGRFIRKTSLDELPQLFNVLRGDLSLVGPRPHAVEAKAANLLYDRCVEGYLARHRVRPGVTGLAQIRGWRGETDTTEKIERRVAFDIYYIDHWSIWLDLYILAATPLALLNTKNAY